MNKPFIVFCGGCNKEIFDGISKNPELEIHNNPKVTQEELVSLLPKVTGLVIRSTTKVDKKLIDAAPNLKYIVRAGEGTDNIDKAYCKEKGIKISNTPGAKNNSAAEHTVALMLTVLRKIAQADASMRKGEWSRDNFTGNELSGKTVGIMGFGEVGQIVAKRLSGFEPNVLFTDPVVHESHVNYTEKSVTLDELFLKSDIITIHVPLNASTNGIVNGSLFSKMKPNAILINTAHGSIVNENDLYECLQNKKIRGAGLDVFAGQPSEAGSKLRQLDNIVLTPHLAGSTEEAQFNVEEMAAHQIVQFFVSEYLLNEVKA